VKKTVITAFLAALLVPLAVSAQLAPKLGVGASAGMNIPVVQDDQGNGYIVQLRGRWALGNFIVVEPNVSFGKYGEPGDIPVDGHQDFSFGIDGSKLTAFGINGTLGGAPGVVGFKPYFIGGIGFYKMSRDETENVQEEKTNFGWTGGFGFALGMSPKIDIDARGQAHIISYEGASRKAITIMVGLNYSFGGTY